MLCPHCHRTFAMGAYCPHDGQPLTDRSRVSLIPWSDGPLTGQILKQRYVLLGTIGQGAMATIYAAEDMTTSEPVAVKILRVAGAQSRHRERFFHEVLAASAVGHPNIIQLHDVGETDNRTPFLVMEYLRGETLGDYLRRQGRASPHALLPLLSPLAAALDAAHDKGIIHRDLKPDNVFLLGAPGEPYQAKLVDFGLSKSTLQLTAHGTAVGTSEYMAPEQALTEPVDARTDVYAFGVVLYRAFAGKLPFDGAEPTEIMARQVIMPPAMPFPDLRVELVDDPDQQPDPELVLRARLGLVIRKALRKRPEHRYASMEALLCDLERVLGRRPGQLEARTAPSAEDVYTPRTPFGSIVLSRYYHLLKAPLPPFLRT